MAEIISNIGALSAGRKVMLALATIATFAAILGMARLASRPNLALLYSGLEPAAAAGVIQSLDQAGAAYDIRGDAIFVDASQRDALRLSLAGEGQPRMGGQGYELLDTLSGFGTTSQMFDAAYWRAVEGELARTILATPGLTAARVHIARPPTRVFADTAVGSASVAITTQGPPLSPDLARSLAYLVSSAVSGLTPDQITVIDSRHGVLPTSADLAPGVAGGSDRAEDLGRRIERLLEARVGRGNVAVEVSIEPILEREEIRERRIDPDSRIAISSESEENVSSAQDGRANAVTVASNLPDGDAGTAQGSSNSTSTQTRERVNFEVSQTERDVVRMPGGIRRISVGVLINDRLTSVDGETTLEPRSEQELESLRSLVVSAAGLDFDRGDTLSLQSMEFNRPLAQGSSAPVLTGLSALGLNYASLAQMAILALVALVLGVFVVRPILMNAPRRLPDPNALPAPRPESAVEPVPEAPAPLDLPPLPQLEMAMPNLPGPVQTAPSNEPGARLRNAVRDREADATALLQGWLEQSRETPT